MPGDRDVSMRKLIIVALLTFAQFVPAAILFDGSGDFGPNYHGKPLSAWMKDLDDQHSGPKVERAEDAVRHIGVDALPAIISVIRQRDSSAKQVISPYYGQCAFGSSRKALLCVSQREALAVCRILGSKAAPVIPALMELLHSRELTQGPEGRDLQFEMVDVLCWIGPASLSPLIQSVSTSDNSTRFIILFGLGQFRSSAATVVPVLLASLHDPCPNCRTQAAVSMGRIAQDEELCVPALTNLLTDPDGQARWGACTALAEFKKRARPAIPALLLALEDADPAVRGIAAIALAKIDPENAPRRQTLMPILINNLEGVSGTKLDSLRFSTIQVIGPWGGQAKAAVPALERCLESKQSYIRQSAGNALKRIDSSSVRQGVRN